MFLEEPLEGLSRLIGGFMYKLLHEPGEGYVGIFAGSVVHNINVQLARCGNLHHLKPCPPEEQFYT